MVPAACPGEQARREGAGLAHQGLQWRPAAPDLYPCALHDPLDPALARLKLGGDPAKGDALTLSVQSIRDALNVSKADVPG